jgi:hypothetical protein
MQSRDEIERRFNTLERELIELRRQTLGEEADGGRTDITRALRLLKEFYETPGQRLQAEDARRAAIAAGLSPRALAGFYAGAQAVLKSEGNWCVLTPSGKQWYEDNFARWMSGSE